MKPLIISILILIITTTASFADVFEDKTLIEKPALELKTETKPEIITPEDKITRINSLPNDEQKVKEWAKLSESGNYVIINKKDCSANVYSQDGVQLKKFEVGIGREKGDDFNDTLGLKGNPKNTTPAGEYTLISNIFNRAAYGDLTLSLGEKANKAKNAKKVVALHKVPKFRQQERIKKFYDGNLANNRMSHGCINFIEKDFKEFRKYIQANLKVYILPEEDDNKLILSKNEQNGFELKQIKY
ncbi:MAG: L,D-transpeptidase [Candidatus Gastranaerophilales bacterium]|nr:L,D-transpeptidase [Candidatus Gastranaerophilales bacterium]